MTTTMHDLKGIVRADSKRLGRVMTKWTLGEATINQVKAAADKLKNSRRKMLLAQGVDKTKIEDIVNGIWDLYDSTKPYVNLD